VAADPSLRRAAVAEFIGTATLLCAVIGSGIMAERLSAGNAALALLANTLATVFILYVLIEVLGPVSGAHFNPVVSLVIAATRRPPRAGATTSLFIAAQLAGAVAGAALANTMFELEFLHASTKIRAGAGQLLAEAVATAGLVYVVLRAPKEKVAAVVACYIGAAYWFTASTSFANPAAVLGRMFSDTFAGIAPSSALAFVAAEVTGAFAGAVLAHITGPPHPQT
jgi:glycerol uptake facilitator-like aquaporin